MNLEELVAKAKEGDRSALEDLLVAIQDRLYNLSLRMLWHPQDAEDATQEILIRIFTHLGTFRGDSAFMTWAYRVASNYLLTTRNRRMEKLELTFDTFGEDLDRGLESTSLAVDSGTEQHVLAEEVKIGCTHAMLLCLDRDHRLAYILGEILELSGKEGASVLDISAAAFRKRLSRAKQVIEEFMNRKCGIVNPENPCRCVNRIPYAMETGRVNPDELLFACRTPVKRSLAEQARRLGEIRENAALLRSNPHYAAPERLREGIRKLLEL